MTDEEFDRLCEAHSFGAVARNEFPLVPRAMLKALVDAAVSTEILKQQDRIKRLEDCAEIAWGIIANVDSGSWQEQRADWREAATRWRDEQYAELSECKPKESKP